MYVQAILSILDIALKSSLSNCCRPSLEIFSSEYPLLNSCSRGRVCVHRQDLMHVNEINVRSNFIGTIVFNQISDKGHVVEYDHSTEYMG